jgi:hypothetical protein
VDNKFLFKITVVVMDLMYNDDDGNSIKLNYIEWIDVDNKKCWSFTPDFKMYENDITKYTIGSLNVSEIFEYLFKIIEIFDSSNRKNFENISIPIVFNGENILLKTITPIKDTRRNALENIEYIIRNVSEFINVINEEQKTVEKGGSGERVKNLTEYMRGLKL